MRPAFFLCLLISSSSFAQTLDLSNWYPAPTTIAGYWEGALVQNASVRLVTLRIDSTPDGLNGSLNVPDIGGIDMPVNVELRGDSLYLSIFRGAGLFFDRDLAQLRGILRAAGSDPRTIHLKKTVPPGNTLVRTEDVEFYSGQTKLAGTIVLPGQQASYPAVVFIAGRGYGTRMEHYSDAVRFARHGIAGIVFDGRGTGQSEGDRGSTTDQDRYDDAQAALNVLLSRDDIKRNSIGLYTYSAGAWVGPRLASQSSSISFIVMVAGPAESLADQQGHVVEYNARNADQELEEKHYEAAFLYQKKLVDLAIQDADWDTYAPIIAAARAEPWAEFVDLPEDYDDPELDYFRRRKTYNPVPFLRQTKIPLLAVYGENEYGVPPQENIPKLEQYLREAGNQDFEIIVFPEADHSMSNRGGIRGEGGWPTSHYHFRSRVPGYLETILNWIVDHTNPSSTN